MIQNLIYSLSATMPLFIMMVFGWLLKRFHFLSEHTTDQLNKVVYLFFLPPLLFMDLYDQDIASFWDTSFVVFCVGATGISILLALLFSRMFSRQDRGEFIQASYRSAAATLGLAFMTNIYDSSSMMSLMLIGSVPVYNIVAVLVLSLTAKDVNPTNEKQDVSGLVKRTCLNILKNPIIIAIVIGMAWSLLKLPLPKIAKTSLNYLARMASPMTLIALGAAFEFKNLKAKLAPLIAVCFNKLVLFSLMFIPVAVYLGYRDEKLVAALIMLASGTTSSSYIMSRNLGHDGALSSSAVMVTTLLSSFTFTVWLFILRTMGYIM